MTDQESKILQSITTDESSFPTSIIASQRVLNTLRADEDVDLGKLVGSEPLLAAKVLRLANSVAFNVGSPVRDLNRAVMKIGTNNVHTLATILVVDQLRKQHKIPECREISDRLWHHSVYVAALSFVMSKTKRLRVNDEALLLGIIHNLGRFYTLAFIEEPMQIVEIVNACHSQARELVFKKLRVLDFLQDACRKADAHVSGSILGDVLQDALFLAQDKDPFSTGESYVREVDFDVDEYKDEIYSVVLSLES